MPLIAGPDTTAKPRRRVNPAQAMRQLETGSDYGRRQAALDLFGVAEAVPALCRQLDREQDTSARAAILEAMVSVGDETVVATLIAMLRSDDAATRNAAIAHLQALAEPVAAHMSALLSDPDPDMRIMAIDILRLLPHPSAPDWIRQLLETETHINVVGAAVDRLAEIGTPDHLPQLAALRQKFASEPYIAFAVDFVSDRIRTLEAEDTR